VSQSWSISYWARKKLSKKKRVLIYVRCCAVCWGFVITQTTCLCTAKLCRWNYLGRAS